MTEQHVTDIVEIRASMGIVQEAYHTLQENVTRRCPPTAVPYLPSYDDLLHLREPEIADAVGYHLWQATKLDMAIRRTLVPSPVPILGRFLDRLKLEFHSLVVYYLNMITSQEATAYANLALALKLLAQDVADLKARVGVLEGEDEQRS
jgi:hypothetical protein